MDKKDSIFSAVAPGWHTTSARMMLERPRIIESPMIKMLRSPERNYTTFRRACLTFFDACQRILSGK